MHMKRMGGGADSLTHSSQNIQLRTEQVSFLQQLLCAPAESSHGATCASSPCRSDREVQQRERSSSARTFWNERRALHPFPASQACFLFFLTDNTVKIATQAFVSSGQRSFVANVDKRFIVEEGKDRPNHTAAGMFQAALLTDSHR